MLTLTSRNFSTIFADDYIGGLDAAGCRLFLLADYTPVEPGTEEWVLTPAQREQVQARVSSLRRRYRAIFVAVPWDESETGGCLSAGRGFVHINASGEVEPRPFWPPRAAEVGEAADDRAALTGRGGAAVVVVTAGVVRMIARRRAAQLAALLLILIFVSYGATLFTDKDPNKTQPSLALRPPSLDFPMGTDGIGRDNFARFLHGGQRSLRVGLVGISIGALIGITLGLASGYFGGWLDSLISWFTDVLMAFPDILLALAIIAILGPGISNAMLAIGIAFVPSFMRLTRSSVLALREMTYIEASRALGSSDSRILIKHILPNSIRTLLIW